jgi:hypothetical protein
MRRSIEIFQSQEKLGEGNKQTLEESIDMSVPLGEMESEQEVKQHPKNPLRDTKKIDQVNNVGV